MRSKVTDYNEIVKCFKDGMTIAIGGQCNHGSPNKLIECLLDSGVKHLTTVSLDAGDALHPLPDRRRTGAGLSRMQNAPRRGFLDRTATMCQPKVMPPEARSVLLLF